MEPSRAVTPGAWAAPPSAPWPTVSPTGSPPKLTTVQGSPGAELLEAPRQELEGGTQHALDAIGRALEDVHASVLRQVSTQLEQLTKENMYLREQLGAGSSIGDTGTREESIPRGRPANPHAGQLEGASQTAVEEAHPFILSHAAEQADVNQNSSGNADTVVPFPMPSSTADTKYGKRPAWETGHQDDLARKEKTSERSERQDDNSSVTGRVARNRRMTAIIKKNQVAEAAAGLQELTELLPVVPDDTTSETSASSPSKLHRKQTQNQNVKRGGMFPDKSEMMAKVQAGMCKPEYKVSNFYSKVGRAQSIARTPFFDNLTLAIIGLNSLWIAIDIDHNKSATLFDADPEFIVVENLFCLFFTFEISVRFIAFEKKRNCVRDFWFVFDSCLVTVGVMETWVIVLVGLVVGSENMAGLSGQTSVLRLFRTLRLARTARMARLLRAVPELMIMFKGMFVASHAVACTIFLLGIIIYMFALTFRQLTDGTPIGEVYFRSVPRSMGSLLLHGTLPDAASFVSDLDGQHLLLGALGLLFVLIAMLVVLNMLAGVLVNVVLVVADLEKEQADATFVKSTLPIMMQLGDADGDAMISKVEFDALLVNPQAAKILEQVNVDIMGLVELSDFIFDSPEECLPFEDFFKLILKLRGSNVATVKDIVEMRKFVVQEISLLETYLGSLLHQVIVEVGGEVPLLEKDNRKPNHVPHAGLLQ